MTGTQNKRFSKQDFVLETLLSWPAKRVITATRNPSRPRVEESVKHNTSNQGGFSESRFASIRHLATSQRVGARLGHRICVE